MGREARSLLERPAGPALSAMGGYAPVALDVVRRSRSAAKRIVEHGVLSQAAEHFCRGREPDAGAAVEEGRNSPRRERLPAHDRARWAASAASGGVVG